MDKVLAWAHGKKTTIFTIAGLIVNYLLGEAIISQNLGFLLASILVAIGGSADLITIKKFGLTKK